ncbi:MAG: HAD family hydrolase [Novosphingobium sp.]|nr:HAD family hydrolase [Novosphingobium sp.]MCP5404055.1 HAD family hydrolase [Novosphingobium sp.]
METIDWRSIRLVVFDMDGTLYDQRVLRMAMLRGLLLDAFQQRSLKTVRSIAMFRRVREELAETESPDFAVRQYEWTAERTGTSAESVRALVEEWIEKRPLRHLLSARFPGIDELLGRLRERGIVTAVWSDYPATEKMEALGLQADLIVSADHPEIGMLKPSPAGLRLIMEKMGCCAEETIMIGDRKERDGLAAETVGVRALIKTKDRSCSFPYFNSYGDAPFRFGPE